MGYGVGIDLGTTNSLVAVLEGQTPRLVRNAHGSFLTPSVVALLDTGELVVGEVARRQLLAAPDRAVAHVKRLMGESTEVSLGDRRYSPIEISAVILRQLKRDAEGYLGGEVDEAVITVPAYFTDAQREATKVAGELAGLRVDRILNEPTAAALAYGLDKMDAEEHLLVYDLGGGTFDVSVLELFSGVLDVKASAGNNQLGGLDFDAIVASWLEQSFAAQHGARPKATAAQKARLLDAAERAKIALSSATETTIRLPFFESEAGMTVSFETTLARPKFNELVAELTASTLTSVELALTDAKLARAKLGPVVLVGGSSRMPVVREQLAAFFGKELRFDVDPDCAVALGAAIQMGLKKGAISAETGIMITDVCPFTLGVEVSSQAGSQLVHGMFSSVIPRNSTIPVSRTERFSTTADGQKSVTIRVFQGESRYTKNNVFLDQYTLDGVPPGGVGKESVAVTFTYDINGILRVETEIVSTGKKAELVVERRKDGRGRMSKSEAAAARTRLDHEFGSSLNTALGANPTPSMHVTSSPATAANPLAHSINDPRHAVHALMQAAQERRPSIPEGSRLELDGLLARGTRLLKEGSPPELQSFDVSLTDFLFKHG